MPISKNRHDSWLLFDAAAAALAAAPSQAWAFVPGAVFCCLFFLSVFGVYRTLWRYADADDFFRCLFSGLATGAFLWPASRLLPGAYRPETSALLSWTLSVSLLLPLARYVYRERCRAKIHRGGRRLLVVGAGQAASTLIAEIRRNPAARYIPVCAVDDDRRKLGMSMLRTPIVGTTEDISEICRRRAVDSILIAIPSLSGTARGRILALCRRTGCRVLSLPGLGEIITEGGDMLARIRQVDADELLGRAPVRLEQESIREFLQGRRVMVTGGGGSIGGELCRQIAACDPARLSIVDIAENSVFAVQRELAPLLGERLTAHVASVRDREKLTVLMESERPQLVFHAAAHKHVPLMENAPDEAVKNNLGGTLNAARAAAAAGAERFVFISTDKAVRPASVMGATKRLCELAVQAMNRQSGTEFAAVRFGNVLDSSGSVVPIFRQQIACGGPVTVTHPKVSRYFMTIPEAVSLVLAAAAGGCGGKILILDMGKPVLIRELAENLIRLSGLRPYADIPIVYTGLRPGEKLSEELVLNPADVMPTANRRIWAEASDFCPENPGALLSRLDALCELAKSGDSKAIMGRLEQLVPDFVHDPDREQQLRRPGAG
jgi:FlaA1/EpsC-like NDP-sugar epimerase